MSKTEFFKIHQGSKLTNESFLSFIYTLKSTYGEKMMNVQVVSIYL